MVFNIFQVPPFVMPDRPGREGYATGRDLTMEMFIFTKFYKGFENWSEGGALPRVWTGYFLNSGLAGGPLASRLRRSAAPPPPARPRPATGGAGPAKISVRPSVCLSGDPKNANSGPQKTLIFHYVYKVLAQVEITFVGRWET